MASRKRSHNSIEDDDDGDDVYSADEQEVDGKSTFPNRTTRVLLHPSKVRKVLNDAISRSVEGGNNLQTAPNKSRDDLDASVLPALCFGSLCDLKAQVSAKEASLKASGLLNEKVDSARLSLKQNNAQYMLCYNATQIGVLSSNTCDALEIIRKFCRVQYVLDHKSIDLESLRASCQKPRNYPILSFEIILYGDSSAKRSLGTALSDARLYLQPPRALPDGVILDNPHALQFPDLSDEEDHNAHGECRVELRLEDPMEIDARRIFENLDQGQSFDDDSLLIDVKTNLLSHQRRAVHFILHRELDTGQDHMSVWACGSSVNTANAPYIHRITKKMSSQPRELLGGIVADEMGLGKTLTLLASISASQEAARNFQHTNTTIKASNVFSRATLVVVPSTLLLDNWVNEITRHFNHGKFSVHRYHGNGKEQELGTLANHDIVLTTYATLVKQFSKKKLLHSVFWYRIILDEAHEIRNWNSQIFLAVSSLDGRSRWCLTGTPIQNSLDDLGALVRFLRVPTLRTARDFNHHCIKPVVNEGASGFDSIITLLRLICIRRTKELLDIPKPKFFERRLSLCVEERKRYNETIRLYKAAIDDAICEKKAAEAYQSIFTALFELRLLCSSGRRKPADRIKDSLALTQDRLMRCIYCEDDIGDASALAAVLTTCSHCVCSHCCEAAEKDAAKIASGGIVHCLQCSMASSSIHFLVESKPELDDKLAGSSKVAAVVGDLKVHSLLEKCIVFSCWRESLKELSKALKLANVDVAIIDGSLTLSERRIVLKNFERQGGISVLLMTLGTGAVGLNLTIASRIYLMEPQWNPTVEAQAIGRAIRFGQTNQVTIVRYIFKDTVEEYIQNRQRHKLQLAKLGLNTEVRRNDDEKIEKVEDLRDAIGI